MPENVQISLGVKAETKQAQSDVSALNNALRDLQSAADAVGKGGSLANYGKQIKSAVNSIASANNKVAIQKAMDAFNQTPNIENLTKFSNAVEKEYNLQAQAAKEAAKETSNATNEMASSAKRANGVFSNFGSSLARIAKLRLLRGIIRAVTQAFREGTENLYQYSAALGNADSSHFASTMNELASSFLYLKNCIGSVVAPLLSSLVPALQTVISWVALALDYLAQLFAVLNGQSTYSRAKKTATAWKDVGGAIGGATAAAKEYKNTILGFDELNVLNDTSGGGGGGGGGGASGPNYSDMFEEVEIPKNALTKFAEWIKPVMQGIWQVAKDSVNGFLEGIPAAFDLLWGLITNNEELIMDSISRIRKIVSENKVAKFLINSVSKVAEFVATIADNITLWVLDMEEELLEKTRPFLELLGIDVDTLTGRIEDQRKKVEEHKLAIHQEIEKWQLWCQGVDKATIEAKQAVESWELTVGVKFGTVRGLADGVATAVGGVRAKTVDLANYVLDPYGINSGLGTIKYNADEAWNSLNNVAYVVNLLKTAALNGIEIAVTTAFTGGGGGTNFANGGYVTGYANGGYIPAFASGGISSANLFMAHENGSPELIGQIGNRTAVANTSQMVDAKAQGVYRAMVQAQGSNNGSVEVNVDIDGVRVAQTVDRANRQLNRRYNVSV